MVAHAGHNVALHVLPASKTAIHGVQRLWREFVPHRGKMEVQGSGFGRCTLSFGEKTLKIALVLSVDPDATAKHELRMSTCGTPASWDPGILTLKSPPLTAISPLFVE